MIQGYFHQTSSLPRRCLFLKVFHFEIITQLQELEKNNAQSLLYTSPSLLNSSSYKTIEQYQNQETDIDLILLARLSVLSNFTIFYMHSFPYVCVCFHAILSYLKDDFMLMQSMIRSINSWMTMPEWLHCLLFGVFMSHKSSSFEFLTKYLSLLIGNTWAKWSKRRF